jgi:hypothetical protein
LLGRRVEMKEAARHIADRLGEIFDLAPRVYGRDALETRLRQHEEQRALAAV